MNYGGTGKTSTNLRKSLAIKYLNSNTFK